MRVRMTRTERGSPDGMTVNTYVEGQEYAVPSDLGRAFVSMGAALDVDNPAPQEPSPCADSVGAKPPEAENVAFQAPETENAAEVKIDGVAPRRRGRKK